MDDAPRAFTKEEGCKMFMDHLHALVRYWARVEDEHYSKIEDRLNGLMHSVLVTMDGCSGGLPAFTLTPDPNPDDMPYLIEEGENYWANEPINESVYLHETWYTP